MVSFDKGKELFLLRKLFMNHHHHHHHESVDPSEEARAELWAPEFAPFFKRLPCFHMTHLQMLVRSSCYAMSWQLLDESARRARVIWVIPDSLRVNPRTSRSFSAASVNPDALIDYIDNAVASFEHDRASSELMAQFPPNGHIATSEIPVAQTENPNSDQKGAETDVDCGETVLSLEGEKLIDNECVDVNDQNSDDKNEKSSGNGQYNAKEADEAYRAACLALSEGHAELALSLLQIASVKCPPNKHNAIRKVKQLSSAAMQLLEKKSAALTLIPVEKNF